MLVREVMTRPAVTIRAGSSPREALAVLSQRHLTVLPVVDEGGALVGILSEADLLDVPLISDPRSHLRHPSGDGGRAMPATVAELMTPDPHTTTETADLSEVAHTFSSTRWKSLPVVAEGRVIGVVSRSDVIRALARTDADIEAEVSSLLRDLERGQWHVRSVDGIVRISGGESDRDRDAAASLAATVAGVRQIEAQPLAQVVTAELWPDADAIEPNHLSGASGDDLL